MKTRKFAKGLIGAFALASASLLSMGASAHVVTEWGFVVTTTWTGAAFGPGDGTPFQDADEISWGATGGSFALGGDRSALTVDNPVSAGSVFTNGAVAETTQITHHNNAISADFATLTGATLSTSIELSAINPPHLPDPAFVDTIQFDIQFLETLNVGPCDFPSDSVCDDIFVISFESLDNSFEFDGQTYFISVVTLEGNLQPLPAATCEEAGAAPGCFGFTTPENAITPEQFGILITTAPVQVPAPGALALMGLGLLGLGYSRRRKLAA